MVKVTTLPLAPGIPRRLEAADDRANTALVGDNHGMFHQVGPVGPFDRGTLRVTPRAELAPAAETGRSPMAARCDTALGWTRTG